MNSYPELDLAIEDMRNQVELYKPSTFWDNASCQIENDISENGIEKFRSMQSALGFFVPTYGCPGSSFSKEHVDNLQRYFISQYGQEQKAQLTLENFLNGSLSSLADYRVLMAADNPDKMPYLHTFSESSFGDPSEQFEYEGRYFSRSALNYLLGLAWLKKYLDGDVPRTVMEIGGGFGTLGEVLSYSGISDARYIDIDIPPMSFIAQHYLSHVYGIDNVKTYAMTRNLTEINITDLPSASVFSSWQIEQLKGEIDLFLNFISFQEMEPNIVKNYFSHVVRLNTRWILLRNMREGKQLRKVSVAVGVKTPILSEDYLEMLPEYELVARNIFPFGHQTIDGYHSELLLLRRKQ